MSNLYGTSSEDIAAFPAEAVVAEMETYITDHIVPSKKYAEYMRDLGQEVGRLLSIGCPHYMDSGVGWATRTHALHDYMTRRLITIPYIWTKWDSFSDYFGVDGQVIGRRTAYAVASDVADMHIRLQVEKFLGDLSEGRKYCMWVASGPNTGSIWNPVDKLWVEDYDDNWPHGVGLLTLREDYQLIRRVAGDVRILEVNNE